MMRVLAVLAMVFSAAGCSFLGGTGLTLDVDALELDGVSAAVVTLSNYGPVAAEWNMLDDATWLAASPSGGTLGPWESTRVVVFVDRASSVDGTRLERRPGSYFATATAASEQGVDSLHVSFRVNGEPTSDACVGPTTEPASLATPAAADPFGTGRSARPDAPPTRVIIKMREATDREAAAPQRSDLRARAVAMSFGLVDRRPGPGRGLQVARIPAGSDPEALVERLSRDPSVEWAELDRSLDLQRAPVDDPELSLQWAPCRFGLAEAWSHWSGSLLEGLDARVGTIAVIDSGVDADHPDLHGRVLPGYDFCPSLGGATGTECAPPETGGQPGSDFHGTHVAGIAAAIGDNGLGIAGVAWGGARILPVKVFDDTGSSTSITAVACGIYWSIGSTDTDEICGADPNENPARILNLSLGGRLTSPTLDMAVAAATQRGALVFAATGNRDGIHSHNGILTPANAPGAIAVGSVNSNFERSSFSLFDVHGGSTADLMAPGGYSLADGSSIYSTDLYARYSWSSGTSMATPYAAGVAALLWTQDPSASPEEIYARMRTTAHFDPGWTSFEYGAGVVCADAALGLATRCGMPN